MSVEGCKSGDTVKTKSQIEIIEMENAYHHLRRAKLSMLTANEHLLASRIGALATDVEVAMEKWEALCGKKYQKK